MTHQWPILLLATFEELLLYNPNTTEKRVLLNQNGPFYGLSWNKYYTFVGVRYGPGGSSKVRIYDPDFLHIGDLPGTFDNHHQILYLDSKLYVTNTGMDRVDIWDGQNILERDWTRDARARYGKADTDRDMHHINSLWAPSQDSSYIWVGFHNMTTYSKRPSQIKMMNLDFSVVHKSYDVGESIHNVYAEGDMLYTCSSGKEELLEYDMTQRQLSRRLPIGRWIRGLGVTDEYFVVGSSQMGMGLQREEGSLGLSLVHRPSWTVVDRRTINTSGAVFELRIVDQPDHGHNGMPCPINWSNLL